MRVKQILMLALCVGLIPTVSAAAIINVPGDFSEIRDAIDAAVPGDTVQVESGVYTRRVRIEQLDGLTVQGVDTGTGRPIIRPDANDDAFRVRDSSDVTITGFRMEGGERGVRIEKDTANVNVTDNEMDGGQDGVRVKGGSGHIISNNAISNTTRGRGVRIDKASGVMVDSNVIGNAAREGVRATRADGVSITNNVISNSGRDGIRVKRSLNAIVGDDLLGGNSSSSNARTGIRVERSDGVTIANNAADDNTRYGFRVRGSAPISSVADLLAAGNLVNICNGTADFRVGSESVGGCGGGSTTTSSTTTSSTTTSSTTTTSSITTTTTLAP